jgi:N-acetylglucosamine kinase-like BadF-type ATPase
LEAHRLAPLVFDAADQGDPVASEILARQGREIALYAAAALRRLEMADDAVPVVLGGAVAARGHPIVMDAVGRTLAELGCAAEARVEPRRPILGAGLAALEWAGADEAAASRFSREFEAAGIL